MDGVAFWPLLAGFGEAAPPWAISYDVLASRASVSWTVSCDRRACQQFLHDVPLSCYVAAVWPLPSVGVLGAFPCGSHVPVSRFVDNICLKGLVICDSNFAATDGLYPLRTLSSDDVAGLTTL